MGGSSPKATPIQLSPGAPPRPPPGYGAAKSWFEQIFPQLWNMPLPSYQGNPDPGLSPTMQNLIRGAQTYSQSPFPQSLEQASGTLGAFQNFDKLPGASRPYEFDPSHQKMYQFQNPHLPDPRQGQGPPPNYGFNPQPQVPGMARGGAGGYGADKIVKMQAGGGGGFGWGIPGWGSITPGFNGQPFESGGYWWDPGGGLAFNPNEPTGSFAGSNFAKFWDWLAGQGGFTPGQQHGPNAQPWDANPPSGFEGGRSGPIDPTDPADPHKTPYGWWTADPNQLGEGQQMPPWLAGLNDEEMAQVFDLVGKVPEGMEQPWDWIGEQLAAEGLIDLPGPNVPSAPGKGRGGGGGGGGVNFNWQGIPTYQPPNVNSSFVGWDPGNPTPSMVPGNALMPPPQPDFIPPPMLPPPPGGGGGGGGGPSGGGGGGGGQPPPRTPAPAMSPGLPMPPMPFFPMHRGPGGGGGMGFRPGGGAPNMGTGNEVAIPMFAKGNVVDEPQLALIGEAGPEVVLPLTRRAAHPGIQKMQDQLGLPAKPMQTGGAAGMGGNVLQRKPAQIPGRGFSQMPLPGGGPGAQRSDPNQVSMGPGRAGSGMGSWGNQAGLMGGPGRQVSSPGMKTPNPGWGEGMAPSGFQTSMPNFSSPSGAPWSVTPFSGGGGTQNPPWQVSSGPAPVGPPGGSWPRTASPGGGFSLTQLPGQMPGEGFPGAMPSGSRTAPPGMGPGALPGRPGGSPDPRFRGSGQAAFDAWSRQTGNQQGLSFEDWMKPSQANWFKDQWAERWQGQPGRSAPPGMGPGAVGGGGNILEIGGPGGVPQIPGGDGGGPRSPFAPQTPAGPPGSWDMGSWPGGSNSGMAQMPLPGGNPGMGQDPFGPTSAMDVYRSAVPVMNTAMEDAISGAMAQSGVSGNRFSTSALNTAGKIGQEAGQAQNQLMSQLLYDQTNQDLNRSLEATGMGLEDARFRNQLGFQGEQNALDRAMQAAGLGGQFGQMQDQMMQDRLRLPFQMGAWEQGRADQMARLPYDDFMQSRLGFMPYLFNLIASQGGSGGMSPQFGVQQTGGSPGALDYISALAPLFMGMMAKGGAGGYGASRYLEGGG